MPVAMLLFSGVSMLLLYVIERVAAWLPWNPQALATSATDLGVQYRRFVHDEYELAVLRARNHHELFHANGRARVSQLRIRGRRHRAGHRSDSRHRAPRNEHDRKFLGGSGALISLGAAAGVHRHRDVLRLARSGAESEFVHHRANCGSANGTDHRRGRQDHDANRYTSK